MPNNHSQEDTNRPQQTERQLEQADFSVAARRRQQLRTELLGRASSQGRQGLRHVLRPILEGAGLLALLGVFFLVISTLFGGGRPLISGQLAYPAGPTQVVLSSPPGTAYPLGTPLPASTRNTPLQTATLIPYSTLANPTATSVLEADLSPDAVRRAISQPSWTTLWVELELDTYSTSNPGQIDQRQYSQAWLENGKRGLVFDADAQPADEIQSPPWSQATFFDGKAVSRYEPTTGKLTTLQPDATATINPLASVSPTLALIYPDFLMVLSSSPRPQISQQVLGRLAMVTDWGNARLWVDFQTGLLLKAELYGSNPPGSGTPEKVLSIQRLTVDPQLDESYFQAQNAVNLLAILGANRPAVSQPVRQPSPTPWANYSSQGWLYVQTSGSAPFDWKVYSLPASCLFGQGPCTASWQLPGNPNIQIIGLQFAPDHSIALFSNTNVNALYVLEVQNRRWLQVVQGFFQMQLTWSPNGRLIAALNEGDGPYDDGLAIVQRDGWTVRRVPTTLKGNKEILGWLDASSVAVLIRPVASFKGGTPAWVDQFRPGLFKVDINTGQDTILIEGGDSGAKGPSLSPDGSQLAFAELEGGRTVLGLSRPDGSGWHSLGVEGGLPRWSPDGQWISFESNQQNADGSINAYIDLVSKDGTIHTQVLHDIPLFEYQWSPDSKYLLIVTKSEPEAKAFVYSLDTKQLQEVQMPVLNGNTAWNLLGWEP